jgi:hypothetical protein
VGQQRQTAPAAQPDPDHSGRGGRDHRRFRRTPGDGLQPGGLFTGIPQFSLHAWFFAIATAIGTWFGARFTLLPLFRIPVRIQKVSAASPLTQKPAQARRRFRAGMLVFFAMIAWITDGSRSA